MTAFDTRTNTGSTTFTNAYGTVELLASDSVQKASGFIRTTGWKYFEMVIDDQGGDNSRLFVGVGTPNFAGGFGPDWLVGGNSVQADARTGVFSPPLPYLALDAAKSLTACTGDVFMFAVDMTGGGRDHTGLQRVLTTSDGMGNILLPYFAEVGKNGVWPDLGKPGWSWVAHGINMQMVPWAVRDSTSGSAAKVSLRGVTSSFAYPIPAGMTAYGDGPEGGTAAVDDFGLAWDPAHKGPGTRCSLSGSDLFAVMQGTGEGSFTTGYVMSINMMGLTGKRYAEFIAGSNTTTWSFDNASSWELGLFDSTDFTQSAFDVPTNALLYQNGSAISRRGATWPVTSLSAVHGYPIGEGSTVQGFFVIGCMVIDFDNKLVWIGGQGVPSASVGGVWTGFKTAPGWTGQRVCPYSWGATVSTDGIALSITASTSIVRIGAKVRMTYAHQPQPISLRLNGSGPFYGYPLLPGIKSMNGGRTVAAGQGDSWDVTNNPASATYGAAGLVIQPRYAGGAQCAQGKYAGKKYFEIFSESDFLFNGTTWGYSVGLRLASATSLTWGASPNAASALQDAIMAMPISGGGGLISRYGVTTTWSSTLSQVGALLAVNSPWIGVAVDFDAGKIWFGRWHNNQLFMNWGSGDPATGLNPHATFTASTTLRIYTTFGLALASSQNVGGARLVLVQDDNNVIGMPAGFTTWGGTAAQSVTTTPSPSPSASLAPSGLRNIWPTGVTT